MASSDGRKEVELDPTLDFVAGTVAGIAALAVGHPFDTVKVRFQSPRISSRYRTTFHALSTIVREERFVGLYKGITSPLASCALLNGLIFASYRFLTKLQLEHEDQVPTIGQVTLAGIGTGITSSIVTTPVELVKIRQQALLTPSSAWAISRDIVKTSGIRGLYRGLTATILRDFGYGAYFAAYEVSCRFFASDYWHTPSLHTSDIDDAPVMQPHMPSSSSWPALLLSGGIAGVAGWVATFPFDVVKTRIQGSGWTSQSLSTPLVSSQSHVAPASRTRRVLQFVPPSKMHTQVPAKSHPTTIATVVNSYRAEGVGVFYRGLAPTLIRAIPVNMVTFATFQAVVYTLSR